MICGRRTLGPWMDDYLRGYVHFNSISMVSGQWLGDYEGMYAINPRLRLGRFSPQAELEPLDRYISHRLTH